MLMLLIVAPILIFLFYFSFQKFIIHKKTKEELNRKSELINSLNQFQDIIPKEKIEELKSNIKSTPESELEVVVNTELKNAKLRKKYGEETAQVLKEEKWFLGMTIEQLIDFKGEPDSLTRDIVRKIVKSKFGTFAQNKEKATLVYGEQKFIFIEGKLENCG